MYNRTMRFKRLKEKFGKVSGNDSPAAEDGATLNDDEADGSTRKKKIPAKKGGAKKRKLDEVAEDDEATKVKGEPEEVNPPLKKQSYSC